MVFSQRRERARARGGWRLSKFFFFIKGQYEYDLYEYLYGRRLVASLFLHTRARATHALPRYVFFLQSKRTTATRTHPSRNVRKQPTPPTTGTRAPREKKKKNGGRRSPPENRLIARSFFFFGSLDGESKIGNNPRPSREHCARCARLGEKTVPLLSCEGTPESRVGRRVFEHQLWSGAACACLVLVFQELKGPRVPDAFFFSFFGQQRGGGIALQFTV